MAISYVGQAVGSSSPTADTTITLPTGAPMVTGDLIIIGAMVADTANNALAAPTVGGYTDVIGSTIYSDDVNDVNLNVFYKYYNGTDTTAVFADVGGSNASNAAVCMVFRGVASAAQGGPFSTASQQASGNGTSNADPAQIATASGDAVVIVGATGHTGGATATYTNPANYTTNPAVRAHNDTIDALIGMGYRLSGYANPENPGAFTAATIGTAADNAWAAVTMALKAAVTEESNSDTVSLTEAHAELVSKTRGDSVSLTEAHAELVSKTRGDTVSLSEGFSATRVLIRAYNDAVSLVESFGRQANKAVADTVALTEARLLTVSKQAADTLGLTEGFAAVRMAVKSANDAIGITETFAKVVRFVRVDLLGLTENLQADVVSASGGSPPPAKVSLSMRMGI